MIPLLLLACDTLDTPDPGSLVGYTTGELRRHHTSYCDGPLTIPGVLPEAVTAVWFCESYQRDATCALSSEAQIADIDGALTVTCPAEYEGSGYARVFFLSME